MINQPLHTRVYFDLMEDALIGLLALQDLLAKVDGEQVPGHHVHALMQPWVDRLNQAHERALLERQ
jgi:hypothetical protein